MNARNRGRSIVAPATSRQRGQAMVEYIVGTLFVVMVVAMATNPTMFSVGRDLLEAVKDYFKAFAYAISVAAT